MAIDPEHGVRRVSAGELMAEDLRIPPYQRPYSWAPATALQLLDDIREACGPLTDLGEARSEAAIQPSYVLGAVILHRDAGSGELHVVDGQQRLLTLVMIADLLSGDDDGGVAAGEDPTAAVVKARTALARRVRQLEEDRLALAAFIASRCELIRVETDDPDEAFRVFDSQNYRGKSLLPHDLLKAYHLREMRGETASMQWAIVEGWESVPDDELDRLFSTYLWRIRQWSRGQQAPPFTARHVDVFKGLVVTHANAPSARYHLAAQSAVPVLTAWSGVQSEESLRDARRSRFQIDAPVLAGRSFFEMVTFMLAELKQLRVENFEEPGWNDYASSGADLHELSSKSRYRYVSELYMAALLYYTSRFGASEIRDARHRLFRWALSLRTRLQRVQFVTVNNHAIGRDGPSAFVMIRNALVAADLRELTTEVVGRNQDPAFEKDLRQLLQDLVG